MQDLAWVVVGLSAFIIIGFILSICLTWRYSRWWLIAVAIFAYPIVDFAWSRFMPAQIIPAPTPSSQGVP